MMDPEKLSNSEKSSESPDHDTPETNDTAFAPIAASSAREDRLNVPLSKQQSNASRSLERAWSLNDGVSVSRQDVEQEGVQDQGRASDGEDEFTVRWDENDPLNPRNMSTFRRWLITIIVSSGSICV